MAKLITQSLHKAVLLKSSERATVLDEMLSHLFTSPHVGNPQAINRVIKDREDALSSGIGSGIAVPHVRHDDIKEITVVFGLSHNGISWLSPDYAPVHFVCMLAAPTSDPDDYLEALGSYLSKLRDTRFRNKLLKCRSQKALLELLTGGGRSRKAPSR